jgi:hypothetical protein
MIPTLPPWLFIVAWVDNTLPLTSTSHTQHNYLMYENPHWATTLQEFNQTTLVYHLVSRIFKTTLVFQVLQASSTSSSRSTQAQGMYKGPRARFKFFKRGDTQPICVLVDISYNQYWYRLISLSKDNYIHKYFYGNILPSQATSILWEHSPFSWWWSDTPTIPCNTLT